MRLPQQGSLFICPFSLRLWFIQNTQLLFRSIIPAFSYFGASAKVVHLLRAELRVSQAPVTKEESVSLARYISA